MSRNGTAARTRRDLQGALANPSFRLALAVSLLAHLGALAFVRIDALPEGPRRVIRLLIVREEPAPAAGGSVAAAGAELPAVSRAAAQGTASVPAEPGPAPTAAAAEPSSSAAVPGPQAPPGPPALQPVPPAEPPADPAPVASEAPALATGPEAAPALASADPAAQVAETAAEDAGSPAAPRAAAEAAAHDAVPGGAPGGGGAATAPLPAGTAAAGASAGLEAGEGAATVFAAGSPGEAPAAAGAHGAPHGGASGLPGPPDLSGLRRRIEARKVYPPIAVRNGWEGRVLVEMRLEVDGRLAAVRLVEGSGYAVLDQATITAVRLASPFPPVARVVQVPVEYRLVP